ncbi:MAG: glycoside hydrolase, partial [Nitrospinaceae bacterium]|nr:glycoside hydrolase [Nitrospinaceae bacterium]
CTPYMEAHVLEALFMMGHADDAFRRMKKRYTAMVESDISTLWEDFSRVGTLNHAWSGAPLSLLCKYGAGIAPVTPGYETYRVMPQMGPLKHIKTTVPSVKGDIEV